jgi:hypothetical protein
MLLASPPVDVKASFLAAHRSSLNPDLKSTIRLLQPEQPARNLIADAWVGADAINPATICCHRPDPPDSPEA